MNRKSANPNHEKCIPRIFHFVAKIRSWTPCLSTGRESLHPLEHAQSRASPSHTKLFLSSRVFCGFLVAAQPELGTSEQLEYRKLRTEGKVFRVFQK